MRFAWIDVEDEAEAMGDVDIETFPTVLIAHGSRALFLGPIAPAPTQLSRLIASLQAQRAPATLADDAGQALWTRLKDEVLPRSGA